MVVVAGGDGAVANVALAHTQRTIPLGILPLGTANNIAGALGIRGSWESLILALGSGAVRRLDVGRARAPWGSCEFLESAGIGLIAALLLDAARAPSGAASHETDRIDAARRRLVRVVEHARPRWCLVEADGRDLSDDYLLVEAMNLPAVGPRVPLAPDADPGDGLLDLVLVTPDDRETLLRNLGDLLDGVARALPLRRQRVRALRLRWDPDQGHLDDETWPSRKALNTVVTDVARSWDVQLVIGDSAPLQVLV
jgi:diacylglycerol kinase family enzyme